MNQLSSIGETMLEASDDSLLDRLQRTAFEYFLQSVNPANGLVPDTSREASPSSIAVVGFALSSYPIAVERGWMPRADAVRLTLAALRFFRDAEQSEAELATGYKGFYYHFLDMQTGARMWDSELSMIDSAMLIAGMLAAGRYFTSDEADEVELRALAEELYRRVDWHWSQDDRPTIRMGWKPECGFLHYGWDGYSEAILLYVLAFGSPTHPIQGGAACFHAWTKTYQWENLYGYDYLYAGPLFIHQFSHAWIDFRGIRDNFMREKNCDYFENSRRATLVQREYTRRNPLQFTGYDPDCWGLTACDGPSGDMVDEVGRPRQLFGYAARGVPYGPDDGTLAGWGVLASLPFAPDEVLRATRRMLERYPEMLPGQRYASSFNPSLAESDGPAWVSPGHYGLDQGIAAMMIENHRSGLVWQLMRDCPHIRKGLRNAGFKGGWL